MPTLRFLPRSILLVSLVAAGPAFAQWAPGGVPICAGCRGGAVRALPDGTGGAFVAWQGGTLSIRPDVYCQRILADGSIAPGWPDTGVAISQVEFGQRGPRLVQDGGSGAYAVWGDARNGFTQGTDLYATRVTAAGVIAAGWTPNGNPVVSIGGDQSVFTVTEDGAGGAYVAWDDGRLGPVDDDIYVQRLVADASLPAGWPVNGLLVCGATGGQANPQCAPDGLGGVWVAWSDGRGAEPDVYASRIHADGSLASGWTPDGTLLLGGPGSQTADAMVADGEGGFYLAFRSLPGGEETTDLFLARIDSTGQPVSGWPASGVPLTTAPELVFNVRLISDGLGGVIAMWKDFRFSNDDTYALRILPDGSRAPGWPENGRAVVGPNAWPENPGGLAPDGLGGAYLLVISHGVSGLFSQHLTATGDVAPGWIPDGVLANQGTSPGSSDIVADGAGGAIAVFDQFNTIYAQKLVPDGPVPVRLSLIDSDVTTDRVRLTWYVADGSIPEAAVYRHTESGGWRWAGRLEAEGTGRLEFEDTDVEPGHTYGYRLGWAENGREQQSTETWVEIPSAFTLQLAGFTPNPSTGPVTVSFSLPNADPATLELLDVTGRRIVSREVGSLGAGQHLVRLDEGLSRLRPGMYFVRLRTPGEQLIRRGAIVR